jgi:hypothetical protein
MRQHQQRENPVKRVNVNIATLNMRGGTARNTSLEQKWSYISQIIYRCKIAILAL